jgi:hypothetical protein
MSEAISLGWNCQSATFGVDSGLRKTKKNGYKTCPFDEMVTNYKGIIECIKDDFEFFCDISYLKLIDMNGDHLIFNTKYNFIFNHESPGHANLYITENWPKGINHYIMNDYEEFIIRYKRRIQNIKDLLNSNNDITFILQRPNTQLCDINELTEVIIDKYPLLKFKFHFLEVQDKHFFHKQLLLMNLDKNDNEITRLNI